MGPDSGPGRGSGPQFGRVLGEAGLPAPQPRLGRHPRRKTSRQPCEKRYESNVGASVLFPAHVGWPRPRRCLRREAEPLLHTHVGSSREKCKEIQSKRFNLPRASGSVGEPPPRLGLCRRAIARQTRARTRVQRAPRTRLVRPRIPQKAESLVDALGGASRCRGPTPRLPDAVDQMS